MRNLKLLGLAAIAATALMAFAAGSASATALYSGSTKLGAGSVLDFSIPSGAWTELLETGGEELDKCSTSTVKGKLSTGTTASIEELTWGSCTFPTTTVTKGKLEVVWTSGTNGTVKADGEIGVTMKILWFGTCVYGFVSGTNIGTLTTAASGAATFHLKATAIKLSGSNLACPETASWSGTYTSTEPANLRVEAS